MRIRLDKPDLMVWKQQMRCLPPLEVWAVLTLHTVLESMASRARLPGFKFWPHGLGKLANHSSFCACVSSVYSSRGGRPCLVNLRRRCSPASGSQEAGAVCVAALVTVSSVTLSGPGLPQMKAVSRTCHADLRTGPGSPQAFAEEASSVCLEGMKREKRCPWYLPGPHPRLKVHAGPHCFSFLQASSSASTCLLYLKSRVGPV